MFLCQSFKKYFFSRGQSIQVWLEVSSLSFQLVLLECLGQHHEDHLEVTWLLPSFKVSFHFDGLMHYHMNNLQDLQFHHHHWSHHRISWHEYPVNKFYLKKNIKQRIFRCITCERKDSSFPVAANIRPK